MEDRKQNIIDLIINIIIVVSTFWAVSVYFTGGPDVLGSSSFGCFKYFTTDSNVIMAVGSLIMIFYNIKALKKQDCNIPNWLVTFKFASSVAVTITLLTVVFFLAPVAALNGGIRSYLFFFKDNIFVLHFSTPVLALLSLVLFEKRIKIHKNDCLWAILPTFIYSIIYLVLVVFVKVWTDWYGFTFGGKIFMIPISLIVMYLVTYLVAITLRKIKRV